MKNHFSVRSDENNEYSMAKMCNFCNFPWLSLLKVCTCHQFMLHVHSPFGLFSIVYAVVILSVSSSRPSNKSVRAI